MLKQRKTTFGLGLSNLVPCERTVYKDNKKADIITTGLKLKILLRNNIMFYYLHICLRSLDAVVSLPFS